MRVYVATRRRPNLLRRCVESINERWPVTVTASNGDDVPLAVYSRSGVEVQKLTEEQDTSNWAARWYQCEDALERGLSWWVITDDDAVFAKEPDPVDVMGQALTEYPSTFGVVTRKSAWPPSNWLNEEEESGITLNGKLGIAWAHGRDAYVEAGGFDPKLNRIGDYDLGLRLKICGWQIGECRRAVVNHKNYNEGGISSREGAAATHDERERAAWNYRVKAGERIRDKYPEGIFDVRADGFLRVVDRKALRRLTTDYALGNVAVTAEKVSYVDPA